MKKEVIQPKTIKDSNDVILPSPDHDRKSGNKKPIPPGGDKHDEKCVCQCGSSPTAMYVASAVQYDDEHSWKNFPIFGIFCWCFIIMYHVNSLD